MYVNETKSQTRQRNIANILQAAEKIFAISGYKGASLSVIAEEAGVPKSNIIYYFESKEGLYNRLMEDICSLWLQASNEMDDTDNPAGALTSYIHEKMDSARERPYGSKVWANEIIHGAPFIGPYIEGPLKEWTASRESILRRWMSEGYLKENNPKTILYMIWSTTQHYADFSCQIEALNNDNSLSDEQWVEAKNTVTEIILRGIGMTGPHDESSE
ncbi:MULTISPECIES: TetR/AcrR family transcriptional regulator [unclassified Lentilitoribacter]|uniref:TetR/AcrR family transcriptional regulator n=1 Tax=unclassified Lentilitoribacter TaxID=2647570 RepID=UPI0013A6CB79|nr:TetR/AcrR family transcriptional regulator [Lentilitoribacter sp. Alg239-R112]